MLLDSTLQFCSSQAITGDAISENVIDLGPLGGDPASTVRDIGAGEELHVLCVVETTLDSAGEAATLTVTVESDDNAGLSSATVHYTTAAIAEASLVAGYRILDITLPPGAYQRYLGLRFNAGTEDFTGGTVNAWLTKGRADTRTYPGASRTGKNSVAVLT